MFPDISTVLFGSQDLLFPLVSGNSCCHDEKEPVPTMADIDNRREAARNYVSDALTRVGLSPAEVARKADVDSDTVNDFLSGKRWPQPGTRKKIAEALELPADAIDRVARGETVTVEQADDAVTPSAEFEVFETALQLPLETLAGLSTSDRAEVVAAAKVAALQKVREIRSVAVPAAR